MYESHLPAGVAHLDSGLADVDGDAFPHGARKMMKRIESARKVRVRNEHL
jgi:hypothetical protein